MTRRAIWLCGIATLLLACWLIWFTGLFAGPQELTIVSQVMTQRPPRSGQAFPIVFSLGSDQVIREVRVVREPGDGETGALQTEGQVVWHVAGQSDEAVRAFVYGRPIKGLDPVGEAGQPRGERLEPNVPYHLTVVTDAGRGALTFRAPSAR